MIQSLPLSCLFFEQRTETPVSPKKQQERLAQKDPRWVCASCEATVTQTSAKIQVQGQFEHHFFNPAGLVFQIGCFAEAPGCQPASLPSQEFSWFPAYSWRIVICAKCKAFLGWEYLAEQNNFFGLILAHLKERA